MARIVAQRLGAALGQSIVVENRTGASSVIAAVTVANAQADGYTLLYGESALLITPQLQGNQLNPIRAFAPVAGLFRLRLLVIANNDLPVNNANELVALLLAHPGKYSYGASGVGTVHHFGFELMKSQTGTRVKPGLPQLRWYGGRGQVTDS